MTIEMNIPDDIVQQLAARGEDPARLALESIALESYRARTLSEEQIRRLLSMESRFDVHAFLKEHGVYIDYTLDDLKYDIEVSQPLGNPG